MKVDEEQCKHYQSHAATANGDGWEDVGGGSCMLAEEPTVTTAAAAAEDGDGGVVERIQLFDVEIAAERSLELEYFSEENMDWM